MNPITERNLKWSQSPAVSYSLKDRIFHTDRFDKTQIKVQAKPYRAGDRLGQWNLRTRGFATPAAIVQSGFWVAVHKLILMEESFAESSGTESDLLAFKAPDKGTELKTV